MDKRRVHDSLILVGGAVSWTYGEVVSRSGRCRRCRVMPPEQAVPVLLNARLLVYVKQTNYTSIRRLNTITGLRLYAVWACACTSRRAAAVGRRRVEPVCRTPSCTGTPGCLPLYASVLTCSTHLYVKLLLYINDLRMHGSTCTLGTSQPCTYELDLHAHIVWLVSIDRC